MWTVENYLLMIGEKQPRRKVYYDGDIQYVCDAVHWSALDQTVWKVQKIVLNSDWTLDEIFETDGYDNPATDVTVVSALTFR